MACACHLLVISVLETWPTTAPNEAQIVSTTTNPTTQQPNNEAMNPKTQQPKTHLPSSLPPSQSSSSPHDSAPEVCSTTVSLSLAAWLPLETFKTNSTYANRQKEEGMAREAHDYTAVATKLVGDDLTTLEATALKE